MASSWERLASVTLGSAAATINSGTITAKTHLKFTFDLVPDGSTNTEPDMRFNSDSGDNYAMTYAVNGAVDVARAPRDRLYVVGDTGGNANPAYCTGTIINISDQEKHVTTHSVRGATGNTVPQRRELMGRYVPPSLTTQITSIQIVDTDSNNLGVGSSIIVWGADDQVVTAKDKSSITNMALGTRYEEVDTRKLFRFADNSPSLENLTWVSEKSLVYSGSDHSKPTGLWFKPDGTEFYVIGEQSDTVTQWSMSTANAWDITNASHTNTYDISGQESTPTGIAFSSDGTKMYICGVSGVDTNQYTLSTAWDISGTVTHNGTHSESSRDNAPYDITFGDNGMKFYIIGNQNRKIYQYALGSAYHITSGVSYTTEYNGSSTWGNATDVAFNSDGTRFFVTDQTNDKIFEYALSTAWFVNSASLTRNSSYSSKDNEPHGIQIGNSNENLFLLGWQNDKIHRYTCRSGEWKEKGTA